MVRPTPIALCLLLFLLSCDSPAPEREAAVAGVHQAAFDALLEGDTAALDTLWTADWVFASPTGSLITREQFIGMFESGQIRYDSVADLEADVRMLDGAAAVLGTVTIWYTLAGEAREERLRYTTVYSRSDDAWQMLAWQSTLME